MLNEKLSRPSQNLPSLEESSRAQLECLWARTSTPEVDEAGAGAPKRGHDFYKGLNNYGMNPNTAKAKVSDISYHFILMLALRLWYLVLRGMS